MSDVVTLSQRFPAPQDREIYQRKTQEYQSKGMSAEDASARARIFTAIIDSTQDESALQSRMQTVQSRVTVAPAPTTTSISTDSGDVPQQETTGIPLPLLVGIPVVGVGVLAYFLL